MISYHKKINTVYHWKLKLKSLLELKRTFICALVSYVVESIGIMEKASRKENVIQNTSLPNNYRLLFGRAIPSLYFEVRDEHAVVESPPYISVCDFCSMHGKLTSMPVNRLYKQTEMFLRNSTIAREYAHVANLCDKCTKRRRLKPLLHRAINDIHTKVGFKLCD
jgi:hypothetical protein